MFNTKQKKFKMQTTLSTMKVLWFMFTETLQIYKNKQTCFWNDKYMQNKTTFKKRQKISQK